MLDSEYVDSFQFAGQDIPWLVSHWAKNKPDHPFLIWEPKSGTGRRWTYAEFEREISDVAGATQDINQSYAYYGVGFTGLVGYEAQSNGSLYTDNLDLSDDAEDTSGSVDNCVTIATAPTNES